MQKLRKKCSCGKCADLDINYATDEAYCAAADGMEIFLRRGQRCPKWCPKMKAEGLRKQNECI